MKKILRNLAFALSLLMVSCASQPAFAGVVYDIG